MATTLTITYGTIETTGRKIFRDISISGAICIAVPITLILPTIYWIESTSPTLGRDSIVLHIGLH
jgi:hypothetical protein